MKIRIEIFDPQTAPAAQWRAFHRYHRQRFDDDLLDGIDDPWWPDEATETAMKVEYPLSRGQYWACMDGGEIVALLEYGTRREGTEDYAVHAPHCYGWISVLKSHQRQGFGRRLLRWLGEQMQAEDKAILSINARTPAGHAFLQSTGAELKQVRIKNRLDLTTVDWPKVALWQDVSKVAPPLTWETHVGRVPMDRWAQLAGPLSDLVQQAPLDDLDVPPMRFELPSIRAWYAEIDKHGGSHIMVLLKLGAGSDAPLIGVSNGAMDGRQPDRIDQYLTAVVPEHRGHGLAKALKARFLKIAHRELPNAQWIDTYNAKSNGPMLAINRQLGFKAVREPATYQISRTQLTAHLAARQG